MGRQDEIDEALGRRLTEIAAAAGVDHSRASLEVLYYLPKDFLDRYVELFNASLKLDSGGMGGSAQGELGKADVSGRYRGKRPMVGAGGKRYKTYWVVKSDELLDLKKKVDKRLRQLGRDIATDMMFPEDESEKGKKDGRVQCSRCGRIMGGSWKFCPECGCHRPVGDEVYGGQ